MTNLPETGFLRLSQILQFIPVSKSCWWNKVKTGEYPQPIKLSEKITVWKAEDIRQLIEKHSDKNNGGSNEQ